MIEVTSCGPCGANVIRQDPGNHWAETQTGSYYCSETAHHRHTRNPDAGVVLVDPEMLGPLMTGIPWEGDQPVANRGWLGPVQWAELAMGQYPPDDPGVTMNWARLYRDVVGLRASEAPRCSVCGAALGRGIKLKSMTEAPWVAENGQRCLGGLTHRPGRIHHVSGQINYPLDEAPNGRCSGCGEQVWQRTDGAWANRDGFLACAPSPVPETARHSTGPHTAQCRWCGQPIMTAGRDSDGHSRWQRKELADGEPRKSLGSCGMAPDDSLPHMPYAAVKAIMPTNRDGFPTGGAGATLHMPGDKRYSITPAEVLALIYDLAMTDEEIHRRAARMLVHQMIHGHGQVYLQWEDLLDALGVLDVIPKRLEPKLSKDSTKGQLWSGSVMISEMSADEILTHVMDLLTILGEIKEEASDDLPF